MNSCVKADWKYFILFSIAILLLVGFSACNDENNNQTILKGNIRFHVNNKIYFYSYANAVDKFLANKTAIDSATPDVNGNYSFSLKWSKPDLFDLRTGNTTLASNLFLIPGDKLTINFNEKGKPDLTQDNEAAKRNRFIISFIDTFYEEPATKHFYYIVTNYLSPGQFTKYCDEREQKQFIFYKSYFSNQTVNKDFDNLMRNEIIYQAAVDKLMYAWKKRMKGEDKIIDSSYYNFIKPDFIEDQNALSSPAYLRFLNLYIKDIYERKLQQGDLPEDKSQKLIPSIEKLKITEQCLKNPYREIVQYNIIYDDRSSSGEPKLLNNFSNTPMDSLIHWLYSKNQPAKN